MEKLEKLVKLLNEYHFSGTEYVGYYLDEKENRIYFRTKVVDKGLVDEQRISDERIISKKFGFIKRLVDNDKIDRLTFCTIETPSSKYEDFDLGPETSREDYTNILLMDLAIQEKPIEFLISILR